MSYRTKILISIVGVLFVIGGVVIFNGVVVSQSSRDSSATAPAAAVQKAESFVGGKFEASGITRVSGTDSFLFVDDGRPAEVLWLQLDRDGKQDGSIKPVKLGVKIDDPEGITTDGSYFYVVGSQSRSKSADQPGMARFRFNRDTQSAEDVQSVSKVKGYLVENVAELRGLGARKAKDDGINIEGLAWDPARRMLLLGLRSPIIEGNALLVPLKLRDPGGPFSFDNLEGGKAIRLPLGGMGIRGIEYDERKGLFYIITGATKSRDKTDFKLWEWTGQSDGSGLREITSFDRKLQPEGVTSVPVGDSTSKVIVFDTSRYLKMQ